MFEAFGDHAKRQSLHAGNGLVTVNAVAHDANQRRHFGQPAAIVLALDLDRKNHVGYCTIRAGCLPSEWSRHARASVQLATTAAAHSRAVTPIDTLT
jgi:hypothetical protein